MLEDFFPTSPPPLPFSPGNFAKKGVLKLVKWFSSHSHEFSSSILVGKVFKKALRILGLDERKSRWVVEQNFHGHFQVSVAWFP